MPNCFRLINKSTGQADVLQLIDNQLWQELGGCEPSNDAWYMGWYTWAGLRMACGKSYEQILEDMMEYNDDERMDHVIEVLTWLESRYNIDCWAER